MATFIRVLYHDFSHIVKEIPLFSPPLFIGALGKNGGFYLCQHNNRENLNAVSSKRNL